MLQLKKVLGLLTHKPQEVKNFLEQHDERQLIPYQGHSRSFLRRWWDILKFDTSHAVKETDTFIFGAFFLFRYGSLENIFFRIGGNKFGIRLVGIYKTNCIRYFIKKIFLSNR